MPMNFQPFSPDELAAVETLIEKISVGGHGEWIVPSKLGLTNIFRLLATAKAGGTPTSATLRAPINAEFVARRFHHWYETFAPKFGYTTRRETACPFDALPSANRDLMVATCEAVVRDIAPLFAAQESTQTTLRAPEVSDTERLDELERLLPAMGANVLIDRGERGRVSVLVSFGEQDMKRRGTGKSVRAAIDDALRRKGSTTPADGTTETTGQQDGSK